MTVNKKIGKFFRKISILWGFRMPSFIIFVALFWIISVKAKLIFQSDNFQNTLIFYITGIGISIAVSSAVFTYLQNLENRKEKQALNQMGELILYSAIALIVALITGWLGFEVKQTTKNLSIFKITKYLILIIHIFEGVFLVYAVIALHKGLSKLEKFLYFKYKNSNIDDKFKIK